MDFYELGLFEFLKSHGNAFEAADGIIISEKDGLIRAEKRLMLDEGFECILFRLATAGDFGGELGESDDDIAIYNEECLIASFEPVFVEIPDLEIELTFERDEEKEITRVYSLSEHFYDETELMETVVAFEAYLKKRKGLFEAVYECRNKYSNAKRAGR